MIELNDILKGIAAMLEEQEAEEYSKPDIKALLAAHATDDRTNWPTTSSFLAYDFGEYENE